MSGSSSSARWQPGHGRIFVEVRVKDVEEVEWAGIQCLISNWSVSGR